MSPSNNPNQENSLIITGEVRKTPARRVSPAGVVINRFVLSHHSRQVEAGMPRQASCNITVTACGTALEDQLRQAQAGAQVRVSGFLSSVRNRYGNEQLVLHAENIETINR
ncbi:MAG: primosomal replication protein N [Gammaproteobacteria bacterium RBG_16_57_12]|nr:MAG: primosomal replication protein N [Gammaproteobacteria bacterium RBG_16_57_12]